MCTVTYIPQSLTGFILTSNRDESAARSPQNLTYSAEAGVELIFPKDTSAGGTWIAASGDDRVICVLNGAFVKHSHQPPYSRSRGLMALEFFQYPTANSFFEKYDFGGMEPFTMVVVDKNRLFELRWDEQQTHIRRLSSGECHIWSSATLYPPEVQECRNTWFRDWRQGRLDYSLEAIQHFHRTGGAGDTWNGFVMNRNDKVQTVSITSVVRKDGSIEMIYNDLLREAVKREEVPLRAVSFN